MTVTPTLPVCIDGRMLGEGTGVTSYAGTLIRVLDECGVAPMVLFGGGLPSRPAGNMGRLLRQARAALTPVRRARCTERGGRGRAVGADDLFGQA